MASGPRDDLVKVNNLLNDDIQQHVFGDILKLSALFEVRIRMAASR
jgi:hypothetical protein